MKKILLSVLLLCSVLLTFAQTTYSCYSAEIHKWNSVKKTFELSQKNSDIDITIVFDEDIMNIQAESPSFFKFFEFSKKDISTKDYEGVRFTASDCRKEKNCNIDIIKYLDKIAISIVYIDDGINFRYFVKTD